MATPPSRPNEANFSAPGCLCTSWTVGAIGMSGYFQPSGNLQPAAYPPCPTFRHAWYKQSR